MTTYPPVTGDEPLSTIDKGERLARSVQKVPSVRDGRHPTEKPVGFLEPADRLLVPARRPGPRSVRRQWFHAGRGTCDRATRYRHRGPRGLLRGHRPPALPGRADVTRRPTVPPTSPETTTGQAHAVVLAGRHFRRRLATENIVSGLTNDQRALRDAFLAEMWPTCREWHQTRDEREYAEKRNMVFSQRPDESTPCGLNGGQPVRGVGVP